MSTEVLAPLAIPEQTIVGVGSYTIPVNRYGFLSMSVTAACAQAFLTAGTAAGGITVSGGGGGGGASANANHQWVKSGDTISTANGGGGNAYSYVSLNGTPVCVAQANGRVANGGFFYTLAESGTSTYGWSVSLFRIPKANLPTGLAEGE